MTCRNRLHFHSTFNIQLQPSPHNRRSSCLIPSCDSSLSALDAQSGDSFPQPRVFRCLSKSCSETTAGTSRRSRTGSGAFLARDLETHLDQARCALGTFVGAPAESLAFVSNVTAGINAVLRSLQFSPGDELVATSHEYNASRNVLEFVANLWGAEVVVADIPFPIASRGSGHRGHYRLSHFPYKTAPCRPCHQPDRARFTNRRIVTAMESLGIEVLVDGAHAPGMVPLDLEALGAPYYAANLHKWVCAPKGSGFLYVRGDRREKIRPTSISHGANSPRTDRSRSSSSSTGLAPATHPMAHRPGSTAFRGIACEWLGWSAAGKPCSRSDGA